MPEFRWLHFQVFSKIYFQMEILKKKKIFTAFLTCFCELEIRQPSTKSVWLMTIILLRRIMLFMSFSPTNKVKFNQISLILLTKNYYLSTTGMYRFQNYRLLQYNLSFSFENETHICDHIIPKLWKINLYTRFFWEIKK